MAQFILTHEHKYGTTNYVIKTYIPVKELEANMEALAKVVDADYEENRDEFLTLMDISTMDVHSLNVEDFKKAKEEVEAESKEAETFD